MGAYPYFYFVPYQESIGAALQALRGQEFSAGRYEPALWMAKPSVYAFQLRFPPDETLPAPGARHASIEAAVAAVNGLGTGSILDIDRVAPEPGLRAACPVSDAVLIELLGTSRPARAQLETALFTGAFVERFWQDIALGHGRYIILYANGVPSEVFFAGYPISAQHDCPESRQNMRLQRIQMEKPEIYAKLELARERQEVGDVWGAEQAFRTFQELLDTHDRQEAGWAGNLLGAIYPWGFVGSILAMFAGGLAIVIGSQLAAITTLHPNFEWIVTTGAAASLYAGLVGLALLTLPILGSAGFVIMLPLWLYGTAAVGLGRHPITDWFAAADALAIAYAVAWLSRAAVLRSSLVMGTSDPSGVAEGWLAFNRHRTT